VSTSIYTKRARVASLSRSRSSDDPELVSARTDLAASVIESHVRKIVASAPPLTPAQRDAILAAFAGFNAGAHA